MRAKDYDFVEDTSALGRSQERNDYRFKRVTKYRSPGPRTGKNVPGMRQRRNKRWNW